jgi:hypothetical protein
MRYPELTSAQRMQAAKVAGTVQRLSFGKHAHLPLEQKLTEVHAITRDPVVLGHQLGDCLADVDEVAPYFQACVDLLRAAGADEEAAAEKVAWRRWSRRRREDNPGQPML